MELNNDHLSLKGQQDLVLVEQARKGNEKAYAELLKRYKKSLYHTILRMVRNADDAEDLTIESFAKAFRNLDKYDPKFGFNTWLFKVASNHSIDFLRKKKMQTTSLDGAYSDGDEERKMEIADENISPMDEVIKLQKTEIMEVIVSKLPARYQYVVRLKYYQDLSVEEISKLTEMPTGTVKIQLMRARDLLHQLLKNKLKEF